MSERVASCPSCGGEITFRTGDAAVVICPYCHSVVARGDRDLETLGKVADLVDTGSPLAVGAPGRFEGHAFELTGRIQMRHAAGGIWDEWYAHFEDGRWGWLAEAQGRFFLTFETKAPGPLPDFSALHPGQPVQGLPGFNTDERATAHAESGEGEIPWRVVPNESFRYADLSGADGSFATIDYSFDPPALFRGREVTLADLGMEALAPPERKERRITAKTLSCPYCGGALELRAPDVTEHVGCPYCGGLLSTEQGNLRALKGLKLGPIRPLIPLGAKGHIEGHDLTVIGFMVRSVTYEGRRYPWSEYLLYEPTLGFRWLVDSDHHWSYVRPVPAGQVHVRGLYATAMGETFKPFQRGSARVDQVEGEFYWKVEVGERAETFDRIAPPRMLSEEKSENEVNFSISEYVHVDRIEKTFGVKKLPRPTKPGAIEPNPIGKETFVYGAILAALAIVISLVIWATLPRKTVLSTTIPLHAQAQTQGTEVVFSDPFPLDGNENLEITGTSELARNNWVYVDGDFFDQDSGVTQSFELPIEYYYGYDGGEYWQEGGLTKTVHLSALPAGSWTLRLEISKGAWQSSGDLAITVREGVPRVPHLAILLGLLAVFPGIALVRRIGFESMRWSEADFTPAGGSRDDDDDDD